MSYYRRALAAIMLTLALLAIWQAASLPAASNETAVEIDGSTRIEVANLEEQLKFGLKARRPEEFAFISHVVAMVEADQLPLKMVKETFVYARRKKPYPYVYFERALRIRAARIGIQL